MKLTYFITITCAASALFFTSCDKDKGTPSGGGAARTEKEALADFKIASTELNVLTKDDPAATDPMAGMAKMKTVVAKVNAIKTDGLPADLKDAFTAFRNKLNEMGDLLKDMPQDKAALAAWGARLMADPVASQKMGTAGAEMTAVGEKMSVVAKKYGIDAEIGK